MHNTSAKFWGLFITMQVMFLCLTASGGTAPDPETTLMWYDKPAKLWSDAMPLGNGRLGAMLFGIPEKERILLNEETVWTGGPYNPTNRQGAEHIDEIRAYVFKGDYGRAHREFSRYLMGYPVEQQKYQPLGNLWLSFAGHETYTDYRRDLNLDTALATVSYKVGDVRFTRRAFVSPVDQVIVMHIKADGPGQVSFGAQMTGYRNGAHSNYCSSIYRMDGIAPDSLQLSGRTSTYLGIEGKVRYFARAKFISKGGDIQVDYDSLTVKGADEVMILIPAATNFVNYNDVSADEKKRVMDVLDKVSSKGFDELLAAHVQAHRALFRRLDVDLGSTAAAAQPTDLRCQAFAAGGDDPQLAALYFQFARYLLISSSRPGTKPANLQGIWNEEVSPSWDSKFTTNINLEMNYWSAEVANLSECFQPLAQMMQEITGPGAMTARESYGARGWVLHQNTDIWWATAPMDGCSWGSFSTGGAWLCTQLWDHYLYSRDEAYLARIYPVLKGAAQFFIDTLVEHPREKVLVTCPATSPENVPKRPGNRQIHDEVMGGNITPNICAGPTMDMQIIRDLFSQVIQAARILDRDVLFSQVLTDLRKRLAPMKIGQHGQLQEWLEDWDDPKDTHRHFSHLYGIFPSSQINLYDTPVLARAAQQAVEMRGDLGTGFSMAWKMAIWARLLDGEHAHTIFRHFIDKNTCTNLFTKCFSTPQVEGSFGVCAAIAEMLMQSYDGRIHLLPALPKAWPQGRIRGLRARGALEIDLAWKDGKLTHAKIKAGMAGTFPVKYGEHSLELRTQPGVRYELDGELKLMSLEGTLEQDAVLLFD
jgi:alpha-L-fucosidase 2